MEFTKNHIVRWLVGHRDNVTLKTSAMANCLVARGRRHDNSYTDATETQLFIKFLSAKTEEDRTHYKEVLDKVHRNNNDYYPDYFERGLMEMNLLQLMEYIAEKMTTYEESVEEKDRTTDGYISAVLDPLQGQVDLKLRRLIINTVLYTIDSVGYTKSMLEKKNHREGWDTEGVTKDGEVEEE